MTMKLTREPIHEDRVRFDVIHKPCDVEGLCNINDVAVCIQCFTFVFFSVRMKHPFCILLKIDKFCAEFFNSFLEIN